MTVSYVIQLSGSHGASGMSLCKHFKTIVLDGVKNIGVRRYLPLD